MAILSNLFESNENDSAPVTADPGGAEFGDGNDPSGGADVTQPVEPPALDTSADMVG